MVLAAGLGTRLRPLTYEITKPMVPVLDRPVMEHILDLLDAPRLRQVIANLHYFPDSIREYFGDAPRATASRRSCWAPPAACARCAEFFGEEPFLVISGDALTDIDLGALAARHAETGGIATLAVKKVPDTREYGVVLHDRDGRITGFQEKPEPEEALSDLGNCGIYMFDPEIFDYFPERPFVGLGPGRVPGAARERRPVPHPRGARVLERRRLARRAPPGHLRRAARRAAPRGRGRGGQPRRDRRRRARRCPRTPRSRGPRGSGATCRSARACA